MSGISSHLNPALPDSEHETPNDLLRLIPRTLGFSVAEIAGQLGLERDEDAAQGREMEQDKLAVTGAVARLVTYLLP